MRVERKENEGRESLSSGEGGERSRISMTGGDLRTARGRGERESARAKERRAERAGT
jgi:hypothetical protein